MVAATPLWKIFGQHAPLTSSFQKVQDSAENVVKINASGPSFFACRLEKGTYLIELLTTDIARIRVGHNFTSGCLAKECEKYLQSCSQMKNVPCSKH